MYYDVNTYLKSDKDLALSTNSIQTLQVLPEL